MSLATKEDIREELASVLNTASKDLERARNHVDHLYCQLEANHLYCQLEASVTEDIPRMTDILNSSQCAIEDVINQMHSVSILMIQLAGAR